MSQDGGEWKFTDLAPGQVIVTVTHTQPVRVDDRAWVVANEPVMV